MVKIVVKHGKTGKDSVWQADRRAVQAVSSSRECHAFRETKAANLPVTYVSKDAIVVEHNGVVSTIGNVAPRVRVAKAK